MVQYHQGLTSKSHLTFECTKRNTRYKDGKKSCVCRVGQNRWSCELIAVIPTGAAGSGVHVLYPGIYAVM